MESILPMHSRTAPVVWCTDGPAAPESLRSYELNGFLLMRDVFDEATVRELRAEAEALAAARFVSTIFESDGKTVRSVFDVHNLSKLVMQKVVQNERLLDMAERIIGRGLYVHQCHINFKRPHTGGGFFWHSDFTFWYWEDGMREPRAISFLVFLDEQRVENGPLLVVPGSHLYIVHDTWQRRVNDHREAVKHDLVEDAAANGLVDLQTLRHLVSRRSIEPVLGKPGDVLVADANLVHASSPNLGCDSRRILLLILNNVENRIGKPFSGAGCRPEYISSRNFAPIRQSA